MAPNRPKTRDTGRRRQPTEKQRAVTRSVSEMWRGRGAREEMAATVSVCCWKGEQGDEEEEGDEADEGEEEYGEEEERGDGEGVAYMPSE